MSLPKIGHKYELVEGRLTMAPAGADHGDIGVRIAVALGAFAYPQDSGWVLDSSTGFWMSNGNLRCPDVSYIPRQRFPDATRLTRKFISGAPELAVEILSPSDTDEIIHGKIVDYFANGTQICWVVNPMEDCILVYTSEADLKMFRSGDTIHGDPVLPGFVLPLKQVFRR